jgi:hypothetical protein
LHSFLDEHYDFEFSREENFRNGIEESPQNRININPLLIQTPDNKKRGLDDLLYSTSLRNVFESEVTHYKFHDATDIGKGEKSLIPKQINQLNGDLQNDNDFIEPMKLETVLKQERIIMEEEAIKAMNIKLQEVLYS